MATVNEVLEFARAYGLSDVDFDSRVEVLTGAYGVEVFGATVKFDLLVTTELTIWGTDAGVLEVDVDADFNGQSVYVFNTTDSGFLAAWLNR